MNKSPLKKTWIINLLKKIDTINLGNEIIKLENSKNRFLSKDIVSKINLPPFNNSAVDGYALNKKDIMTNNVELIYLITSYVKILIMQMRIGIF